MIDLLSIQLHNLTTFPAKGVDSHYSFECFAKGVASLLLGSSYLPAKVVKPSCKGILGVQWFVKPVLNSPGS